MDFPPSRNACPDKMLTQSSPRQVRLISALQTLFLRLSLLYRLFFLLRYRNFKVNANNIMGSPKKESRSIMPRLSVPYKKYLYPLIFFSSSAVISR